jgi:hypothetical protein
VLAGVLGLTALAGCGSGGDEPPIPALRGPPAQVEARLRPLVARMARRVERLRGLEFQHVPRLELMDGGQLAALGRRLGRRAAARTVPDPARRRRQRRLERASIGFDQLAGLLPPELTFGPDTTGGLDRIGGAYDWGHGRIVLLPDLIATHDQLVYTLAHELTHALEDQNFHLDLAGLTAPGEATAVRRAVVEGTATFVQNRYRHAYLGDQVPIGERLDGMRSVIAAGPAPYAIDARAVFDYADGGLFVRSLWHREQGWRLVNRALRHPPRDSRQVLHPRTWPPPRPVDRVRLGVGGLLHGAWRQVGGGTAGEEQALVILLAGSIPSSAGPGASGWMGGRYALWRPRGDRQECAPGCATGDVGVVAFRWRGRNDAGEFGVAVPAYMIIGLLAEKLGQRSWKLSDGYAALASGSRSSGLAFAPEPRLARALARQAAASAERSGR